jgi:hypothetical protein
MEHIHSKETEKKITGNRMVSNIIGIHKVREWQDVVYTILTDGLPYIGNGQFQPSIHMKSRVQADALAGHLGQYVGEGVTVKVVVPKPIITKTVHIMR